MVVKLPITGVNFAIDEPVDGSQSRDSLDRRNIRYSNIADTQN